MVFLRIRPGSRSSRSPGITVLFHRNMLKHKNKGRLRNFLVLHLEIHNRTNLSSTRRSSPPALSQGVPKRTKRVHLWRALTRVYDVPFWYLPTFANLAPTVLSGAEERFAEERPGWNFSKNKNDPGLENWVQNYTQATFAVKATSPAALLTSKRLHVDGSKHFSRFPGLACVACMSHRYRVPYTRYKLSYVTRRWIEK